MTPRRNSSCRIAPLSRPLSVVLLGLLSLAGVGCRTPREAGRLQPFHSDGCSLFPDGTLADKTLWQECCVEHDLAYWRGGTREERERADARLRDCILEKTGDRALAGLVFDGVRAGGAPVFPTWYRWGYGWNFGRGYKALTAEEQGQVEALPPRAPSETSPKKDAPLSLAPVPVL